MNPNKTIRTTICPCKIEQLEIDGEAVMFFEFYNSQWTMKGTDWRTFLMRISHDIMQDIDNESKN